MKVIDVAKAIDPKAKIKIIGIRPGEKIHEQMIGSEDAAYTYSYKDYYKILPSIHEWDKDIHRISKGNKVKMDFTYTSENNVDWMKIETLRKWIHQNKDSFLNI